MIIFVCSNCIAQDNSQKNVIILGDSNTFIGGDDCNKEKGWNKWFKEFFAPATCKSYARSGATWTNTRSTTRNTLECIEVLSDNNVIYNQVQRVFDAFEAQQQVAPDLIIIACGTNDAWFEKRRPGIYNTTVTQAFQVSDEQFLNKKASQVTSLAESIRYSCLLLQSKFENARIILLTPLQSVHAGEAKIKKVGDTIEACGKKLGLSVIRQDEICCIKYSEEKLHKHYTSDGTHTNELGAETNGKILANKIEEIIKD